MYFNTFTMASPYVSISQTVPNTNKKSYPENIYPDTHLYIVTPTYVPWYSTYVPWHPPTYRDTHLWTV